MYMTTQEFKQKCIDLRSRNYTLGEIIKVLKRPKTSIYFHIKNVSKSLVISEKIKKINIKNVEKFRPVKGVSWKGRHCRGFEKWTPELVNLIAHSIFDGEIKRASTIYHNRSIPLINNFKDKIKIIYDFEPKLRIDSRSGVIRLEYHSIELTNFLVGKSQELLKIILLSSISFQREFLKAFFDDEGSIYFQKKRNSRRVKGYQYNDEVLFLVQKLLKNFGIESKVNTRFHEIVVSRRENLEKFAKEINFSAGLKVNGKRSNSIWKEDLEKREILKRALNSYLNQ